MNTRDNGLKRNNWSVNRKHTFYGIFETSTRHNKICNIVHRHRPARAFSDSEAIAVHSQAYNGQHEDFRKKNLTLAVREDNELVKVKVTENQAITCRYVILFRPSLAVNLPVLVRKNRENGLKVIHRRRMQTCTDAIEMTHEHLSKPVLRSGLQPYPLVVGYHNLYLPSYVFLDESQYLFDMFHGTFAFLHTISINLIGYRFRRNVFQKTMLGHYF